MQVQLVRYTVKPQEAMAEAASACYRSIPREKVVQHCILSGHESISEFADFHFKVSGVSRALTHQLVRHRLASFAQESQRYVTYDDFDYVIPQSITNDAKALNVFMDTLHVIRDAYQTLLDLKTIPAEDARFVLPNACASVIHVKMNYRELMHACGERECSKAQWEIRLAFGEMHQLVAEVSPFLAEFLGPKCKRLGYCPELKDSCGRKPLKEDVFKAYEWWVENQPRKFPAYVESCRECIQFDKQAQQCKFYGFKLTNPEFKNCKRE